ncbi:Uncharacterised protein [Neisseria gonorrhoeae]|uniref:Uncharacterized protein n=1 Tax=Neisseria gonorrhoeae TaxID=485 RepID=A0A378W0L5_NEIGO|nr:Uncharacterised protein [Neisseria gonorrhoeae]
MNLVLPPAHTAGNRHNLMEVVLHKIAAGLCAAFLLREQHHFVIRQGRRQVIQRTDTLHIGYGFNIESQIVFMAVPCIQKQTCAYCVIKRRIKKRQPPQDCPNTSNQRFTLHKQYRLSPAALPA